MAGRLKAPIVSKTRGRRNRKRKNKKEEKEEEKGWGVRTGKNNEEEQENYVTSTLPSNNRNGLDLGPWKSKWSRHTFLISHIMWLLLTHVFPITSVLKTVQMWVLRELNLPNISDITTPLEELSVKPRHICTSLQFCFIKLTTFPPHLNSPW